MTPLYIRSAILRDIVLMDFEGQLVLVWRSDTGDARQQWRQDPAFGGKDETITNNGETYKTSTLTNVATGRVIARQGSSPRVLALVNPSDPTGEKIWIVKNIGEFLEIATRLEGGVCIHVKDGDVNAGVHPILAERYGSRTQWKLDDINGIERPRDTGYPVILVPSYRAPGTEGDYDFDAIKANADGSVVIGLAPDNRWLADKKPIPDDVTWIVDHWYEGISLRNKATGKFLLWGGAEQPLTQASMMNCSSLFKLSRETQPSGFAWPGFAPYPWGNDDQIIMTFNKGGAHKAHRADPVGTAKWNHWGDTNYSRIWAIQRIDHGTMLARSDDRGRPVWF